VYADHMAEGYVAEFGKGWRRIGEGWRRIGEGWFLVPDEVPFERYEEGPGKIVIPEGFEPLGMIEG
jgi:hypothetical protein